MTTYKLLVTFLLILLTHCYTEVIATCLSSAANNCQCAGVCCYKVEENRSPGVYLGSVYDIDDTEVQSLLNQSTHVPQFTVTSGGNVVSVSNNGTLVTDTSLDHEQRAEACYQIFLQVLVGSNSKQVSLAVQVLDVNDNYPTFNAGSEVNISIFETNNFPTDISCSSDLLAVDSDEGQNGTIANYTVISPAMNFTVYLDNIGRLCLCNLVPLDRENQDTINIIIMAIDNGTVIQRNSTLEVRLTLLDINDNPPIFINFTSTLLISETTPINTSIYNYTATDHDIGTNADIYFILQDSTQVPFSLQNGTLFVSQGLDADSNCPNEVSYTLTIIISNSQDGSVPRSTGTTIVTLINENDSPLSISTSPVIGGITQIIEETQIMENQVFVQFTVTDQDCESSLSYSIISGSQYAYLDRVFTTRLFLLRSHSFIVDREEMESLSITALFQDNGNPPNNATVTYNINITDINDNSPNLTRNSFTVTENTSPGVIIATLSEYFTDPDQGRNGSLGYFEQLTQTDLIRTSPSGTMSLETRLDRESIGNSFTLLMAVYDDGDDPQLSSNITITIFITDINDNSPQFINITNNTIFHLSENSHSGTLVSSLQAKDNDQGNNAVITFSILNSTYFYIDPHNGSIFSSRVFDRESTDSIEVVVMATDSGTPPLSSLINIIISITDVNDNSPRFYNTSYNFTVTSDARMGTEVGVVSAWDPDISPNNIIQYEIVINSNGGNYFSMHANGTLYITESLNEDSTNTSLLLIAFNPDNKSLNDTVWVDIIIVQVATPTPVIPQPILWYVVNIGAPVGGALVASIFLLICLICVIRCYRHRCQSRDLYKASRGSVSNHSNLSQEFSNAPKKSSMRSVPVAGSRYEDSSGFYRPTRESTGVLQKSPTVNFSEESEVRFYNTEESLETTDVCTVRVQREEYEMKPTVKKTPDSPDHFTPPTRGTPTLQESKISSPSLSDDLSTSPSLGTSIPPTSNHDLSHFYTHHSNTSKALPVLREELLKKHDREYADSNNTFPSAIVESVQSDDTPPSLPRGGGGNIQGYLASSAPPLAPPTHHNGGNYSSYQNGSLPSGDTNTAPLHYSRTMAPPTTSSRQLHHSATPPTGYYPNGNHTHHNSGRMRSDMYYKSPPINGTTNSHIRQTSSSSSSSSHHHRTPQIPPSSLDYAPPTYTPAPPTYHHGPPTNNNNYNYHSSNSSSSNEYNPSSYGGLSSLPNGVPPTGVHPPVPHHVHMHNNSDPTRLGGAPPPHLSAGHMAYRGIPSHLVPPPGQPHPQSHERGGSLFSSPSIPSTMESGDTYRGHFIEVIDEDIDYDDTSTVASSVLDQYLQFEPVQLRHHCLSLSVDDMKLSSITRNDSQLGDM